MRPIIQNWVICVRLFSGLKLCGSFVRFFPFLFGKSCQFVGIMKLQHTTERANKHTAIPSIQIRYLKFDSSAAGRWKSIQHTYTNTHAQTQTQTWTRNATFREFPKRHFLCTLNRKNAEFPTTNTTNTINTNKGKHTRNEKKKQQNNKIVGKPVFWYCKQ